MTPCYIGGNSSGPEEALVRWSYANTGQEEGDKTALAQANQVGSLWGVAYNKQEGNYTVLPF